MKFTLPKLQLGQIVVAQVVECLSNGEFIVNFDGDLVRVKNQSGNRPQPGQSLELRVTRISPLGFQMQDQARKKQVVWTA